MRISILTLVALTSLLLQGCGTVAQTIVNIQDFSFGIPTSMQVLPSASLDAAQITHSILGAWKDTNASLILSESSLPSTVSLQSFTEQARTRLAQDMMGYAKGKVSTDSFTCNGKKISGYVHSFTQTDAKDTSKTVMYYDQFYFTHNDSVYIISLAQKEQKNIFTSMIDSLTCTK